MPAGQGTQAIDWRSGKIDLTPDMLIPYRAELSRLLAQVLDAAAAEGKSVSAWITDAARRALLVRDGLAAVAEWEAEHGALTPAELLAARARIEPKAIRRKRFPR